jgi:multidrug efflux pump subunit AcrA (membrane-fusion protein)
MTDRRVLKSKALKVGLTLAAAAALVYCIWPGEADSGQRWLAVVRAPLEHRVGLVGRIVPGSSITLTSPFEGHVEDKLFADDQRVVRGQLLLRISPDLLRMQIRDAMTERLKAQSAVQVLEGWLDGEEMARAKRALSSSQLNLADTRRKLAESQGLLAQGIVPRMEVDALGQQLKTQHLDVKAARAELHQVRKRGQGEHRQIADMQLANALARHESLLALEPRGEITAPFAGIVVRLPGRASGVDDKPVEPGVRLSQGQPLFGLASLERLHVQASVDEADINQLREGMPVDISGEGFDDQLRGIVSAVGTQSVADMRSDSASYHVTVAMPALDPASQQRLRLGMTARLSILTYQNADAVVLPADAVGEAGGKHFVIHRDSENGPETHRAVTLGHATVNGLEVFGVEAGFVRREVSMD